jgi:hypothetical protein
MRYRNTCRAYSLQHFGSGEYDGAPRGLDIACISTGEP